MQLRRAHIADARPDAIRAEGRRSGYKSFDDRKVGRIGKVERPRSDDQLEVGRVSVVMPVRTCSVAARRRLAAGRDANNIDICRIRGCKQNAAKSIADRQIARLPG
ncbi:MAG: hypothetical protein KF904_18580 [Rhodoblastus sp.]|nr:hypothetical protein [Rhodoblastus sp.]